MKKQHINKYKYEEATQETYKISADTTYVIPILASK
jgi:hypothetical protein